MSVSGMGKGFGRGWRRRLPDAGLLYGPRLVRFNSRIVEWR